MIMQIAKEVIHRCPHLKTMGATGLVLITIGSSLRGDDDLACALCNALPSNLLNDVCRFYSALIQVI